MASPPSCRSPKTKHDSEPGENQPHASRHLAYSPYPIPRLASAWTAPISNTLPGWRGPYCFTKVRPARRAMSRRRLRRKPGESAQRSIKQLAKSACTFYATTQSSEFSMDIQQPSIHFLNPSCLLPTPASYLKAQQQGLERHLVPPEAAAPRSSSRPAPRSGGAGLLGVELVEPLEGVAPA